MAEAEQTLTPVATPSSASTISEQMTPTTEATPSSATSMAEHTPAPAPPVATPPSSSTWRKKPSQKGKTRHKLAKLPTLAIPKRPVAAAAAAKRKKKKRKGGDGERSKPVRRKLDLDGGERTPAPSPKIITPRSGTFYRATLIDNLRSLAKLSLTDKPPPRKPPPPTKMNHHLRCFGRSQLMENLKSLAKRHNLLIPAAAAADGQDAAAAAKGKRKPKKKKSGPKAEELEIVVYSRKRAAGAPSPMELVLYDHERAISLTLRWISVPLLADVKSMRVMGITPEIDAAHGELMRLEETCRGEEMGDSIPESPQLNVMREELGRKVKRFMASTRFVIGKMDFDHPWGGTVVDSVVGTFLTQNVTDHISSNAFMIIAATFAVSKNGSNVEQSKDVPLLTDGCDLGEPEPDNAGCSDEGAKCRDKDIEELIESLRAGEISKWDKGRMKKVLHDRFEDSTAAKIFSDIVSIRDDTSHWDSLREEVYKQGYTKENSAETIDWEALLQAPFAKIAACIRNRGNQSQMTFRILAFLIRIKRDHGSIDLEWLRHVPRAKAKRYLLSIKGLGPKSVDCIRLLSLRHRAFPVDTNVARIATRLGWVELQPLPKGQEFHLVDKYPVMADIQKYLEPLLCNIPTRDVYELHYQMITFGKAICTKKKPNCGSCPLKKECKYFNSLVKRAEYALLGSQQHKTGQTNTPIVRSNFEQLHQYQTNMVKDTERGCNEPIVEMPTTPQHEYIGSQSDEEYGHESEDDDIEEQECHDICGDIEDAGFDVVVDLRSSKPTENPTIGPLHGKEIIPVTQPSADSPSMIKKYNLRTEYTVYEIPDGHEILDRFEPRVLGDCNPYLLIIRSRLDEHTVNATILIPSRTANRNVFPLGGSYYQSNEVFVDHSSSCSPIEIKTDGIWALRQCTVYFGASIHSVGRGQTEEEIRKFYCEGYLSDREFDRDTRLPELLSCKLHETKAQKESSRKRPKTRSSQVQKTVMTQTERSPVR